MPRHVSQIPKLRPALIAMALWVAVVSTPFVQADGETPSRLPWREAGLTERQAAAHLLDRFAFGAQPGDVDRMVALGLDTWLEQQLAGGQPDPEVDRLLKGFRSLDLDNRQIVETYPDPGMVLREASRAGVVDGEQFVADRQNPQRGERSEQRRQVMEYARDQGYRPQRELVGEMVSQKLIRARYSKNQLTEVLTDFWFNHFNVSITDNQTRQFVSTYERDAIRPHVLADFRTMLEATAKHPAMLLYLDNARSVADEDAPKKFDRDRYARSRTRRGRTRLDQSGGSGQRNGNRNAELRQALEQRRPQGLNENYARELMELHTLGVDGGYSQDDVVAVARAFTGWATYPAGPMRQQVEQRIARARRLPNAGFVFEDSFMFRADAHDSGQKTILGKTYPAGRGMEDGLEVLDALAAHPATARHLATKLAVRFVSDQPSSQLVDRLASRFQSSGGDLEVVLRAVAESPEFWSTTARQSKIKSPFELAVSALRVLDVEIQHPQPLLEWIWRMGQPLYSYQAPTGYPDRAEAWVNTGALLNRMNFGLQLATGRIAGLELDLASLNGHREPASLDEALELYVPLLMPERDPTETIRRLESVVHDPEFASKIAQAAPTDDADPIFEGWDPTPLAGLDRRRPADGAENRGGRGRAGGWRPPVASEPDHSALAHVVGVILGSPEFQRR